MSSTIQFPANAIGYFATVRVTTTITGPTSIDVGVGGATTRYGTGIATSSATTNVGASVNAYAAATSVVITAIGGNFTDGAVRLTIHYLAAVAATS